MTCYVLSDRYVLSSLQIGFLVIVVIAISRLFFRTHVHVEEYTLREKIEASKLMLIRKT